MQSTPIATNNTAIVKFDIFRNEIDGVVLWVARSKTKPDDDMDTGSDNESDSEDFEHKGVLYSGHSVDLEELLSLVYNSAESYLKKYKHEKGEVCLVLHSSLFIDLIKVDMTAESVFNSTTESFDRLRFWSVDATTEIIFEDNSRFLDHFKNGNYVKLMVEEPLEVSYDERESEEITESKYAVLEGTIDWRHDFGVMRNNGVQEHTVDIKVVNEHGDMGFIQPRYNIDTRQITYFHHGGFYNGIYLNILVMGR
jgi:hypothetical protein